jgi:Flp pilus assembly protein TadG
MKRDEGAAAVEFALLLSVLVLLVFGIIEFGRAYNATVTLTHAAREGVRELAINRDPVAAVTVTKDAADTLDPSRLLVNTSACEPGQPTRVEASYPFDYNIPLFGSATVTLRSTAVMRCGG